VIGVSRTAKLARTRINDADKNDIVLAFFIGGAPPVLVEVHRAERSGGDGRLGSLRQKGGQYADTRFLSIRRISTQIQFEERRGRSCKLSILRDNWRG